MLSVTNNLSLGLVSDANKCADVSWFLIARAILAYLLVERLKTFPFNRSRQDTTVILKRRCVSA